MSGIVIVDTDILIDVGRNDKNAVGRIEAEEKRTSLAISIITKMELIVRCRNKKELKSLDQFLNRFTVLSIDENIAEKAMELLRTYRLSHGLLIADSLISATALIHQSPLLSKNQKDYRQRNE